MWRLKDQTHLKYITERERERIIGERESEERTVRKKEKGCQIERQREIELGEKETDLLETDEREREICN